MKVTLSLQQDTDATSCRWQKIAQIVRVWSERYTQKSVLPPTPEKGIAEISLDFTDNDLTSAIRELHEQLFDYQVNFTVLPIF